MGNYGSFSYQLTAWKICLGSFVPWLETVQIWTYCNSFATLLEQQRFLIYLPNTLTKINLLGGWSSQHYHGNWKIFPIAPTTLNQLHGGVTSKWKTFHSKLHGIMADILLRMNAPLSNQSWLNWRQPPVSISFHHLACSHLMCLLQKMTLMRVSNTPFYQLSLHHQH